MIASPCIRICTLDETGEICLGCFRTLDEISFWTRYSDAQRADILRQLERRRAEMEKGT